MTELENQRRLNAVQRYLRRNYTRSQLVTLNDAFFTYAITSSQPDKLATILTSLNFGASGGTAALTGLQPLDVVDICEALIAEMDRAGVTSWTAAQSAEYDGPPAFHRVSYQLGALGGVSS